MHGVRYAVVEEDGSLEWKSQTWFLYAYDVCLMANSEEDMEVSMEQMNECVIENGLKVNENKSKVMCINGEVGRYCNIGEVEEYKYCGGRGKLWFQENRDRRREANGLNGEICGREIREKICDWEGRLEDNDC